MTGPMPQPSPGAVGTMTEASVAAVLDAVTARAPHLPHGGDLARAAADAWNAHVDRADPGRAASMRAVLDVAWRAGYVAGAARGHDQATVHLRNALAERLAGGVPPSADAGWFAYALVTAADGLPEATRPPLAGPAARGIEVVAWRDAWPSERDQLGAAVSWGLRLGWRAGHAEAAWQVSEAFITAVLDLVGEEALVSTFMTEATPAYDWLDQIEHGLVQAAEHDRDHPSAVPKAAPAETAPPAVVRGFPPLTRIDPADRTRPITGGIAPPGPGRRRPSR